MENKDKKIYIVSLGHAGGKILDALSKIKASENYKLIAIDTDENSLNKLSIQNKLLVPVKSTYNTGCGGDMELGSRSITRDRKFIIEKIKDASLVIVIGGLGGGTAGGAFPFFARLANRKLEVPIIFMVTKPFIFEGPRREMNANKALKELHRDARVIIPIANDLLYNSENIRPGTNFEEAYLKADIGYANAVLGLAAIIKCDIFLSIDFADFNNIFDEEKCECTIGIGEIDKDELLIASAAVIDKVLTAPLLGSINKIKDADVLFATILGGEDLKLDEIKNIFNILSNYSKNKDLYTGVDINHNYNGKLQLTVLTIKFNESRKRILKKGREVEQDEVEQLSLGLNSTEKGRFQDYREQLYGGEDLDIPTFSREDIYIDSGNLANN